MTTTTPINEIVKPLIHNEPRGEYSVSNNNPNVYQTPLATPPRQQQQQEFRYPFESSQNSRQAKVISPCSFPLASPSSAVTAGPVHDIRQERALSESTPMTPEVHHHQQHQNYQHQQPFVNGGSNGYHHPMSYNFPDRIMNNSMEMNHNGSMPQLNMNGGNSTVTPLMITKLELQIKVFQTPSLDLHFKILLLLLKHIL
ncbi:unnamed protein product [[Candida] boidinii]|uniref:Unnamed protein product n=1 Tax=Candida boidinii TaxID=5477 RepID=A0ACB5U3N3_CANBO|nr:unnamed protein product [[Candida] boidinii]